MVTEQELCLSTFLKNYEHPAIYHKVDIRAKDIDDLNGPVDNNICRNIYEQAILCEHGVKRRHAVVTGLCYAGIVFCHQLGTVSSNLCQRANDNPLGQVSLWLGLSVEAVVDNEV